MTESLELVAPIAEGAMGHVWLAHHRRLKTKVAVKFVSDKLGDSTPEALARFEHEAAMAAQIKSPHVVRTFDSGVTDDGQPYIVMELLEGESLGDRLRQRGALHTTEAASLIKQVARALTAAHELGIVHRDIKPDNLFLCPSDEGFFCKVLDFGIAKQTSLPAMGGLTADGKVVGTPEYMSPEQVLEDTPVDARADLWALAVVMYTSLTAQLPFRGKTLGQLCLQLVSTTPTPPSQLNPNLPSKLDAWFAEALHRDPDKRPKTAREMALGFAKAADAGVAADITGPFRSPSVSLSSDDTERHFGAASATAPASLGGRDGSNLSATLTVIAAGAVMLGVAAITLASGQNEASTTLKPQLGVLAAQAAHAAQSPPLSAIGSELGQSFRNSQLAMPAGSSSKVASPPGLTSASGRLPQLPVRQVEVSATSKPAPIQPTDNRRRGRHELGF